MLYHDLTMLFDHALIVDDKHYSSSNKDSHMTSTRTIERAKFQNAPLRKLLFTISRTFAPLYNSLPEDDGLPTILLATPSAENVTHHEANIRRLNSREFSNWMELSFIRALEYPDDEWGRVDYILNEKAPPVLDPKAKRLYSDMRSSNLGYSQAGTFPAEVDVDEDAEVSEGDKGEGNIEEDYQPPRTRRRVD